MQRLNLWGFRDPVRRPRYILWTVVYLLVGALFIVGAFAGSSTTWFCANGCHKVQDDTIEAYYRSAHNKVSCMSCHEPADADPITFAFLKTKALGELVLTVTNNYHLPLNAESELSQDEHHFPSAQCTQCHSQNRTVTPSEGIIIDHAVHAENEINCTICHNRTAHVEDFDLVLKDPKSGELNRPHEDFMRMEGCFRCHSVSGEESEKGFEAPGACTACHPSDFKLVPVSHEETSFYTLGGDSSGHWKMREERPEYCKMCHDEKTFCVDCHGIEMPHPDGFTEDHGTEGKTISKVCARCHAKGELAKGAGLEFCNVCHHKGSDQTRAWLPQHFEVVRATGAQACFECHDPTYCARCHVRSSR
jgi:hypothetical protein